MPTPFIQLQPYEPHKFILNTSYRIGDNYESNSTYSTTTQLLTDITYSYIFTTLTNSLKYSFYSPTDGIKYDSTLILPTGYIRVDYISETVSTALCNDINQNTNNAYQLSPAIVSIVSNGTTANNIQNNLYNFQIVNDSSLSTIFIITLHMNSGPLVSNVLGITGDVGLININVVGYQQIAPNQLALYDSSFPTFCGNTQEINVSSPLNEVSYRFIGATNIELPEIGYGTWSYTNTVTLPDTPTDRYGTSNTDAFTGYTPYNLVETLAYLLKEDIMKNTSGIMIGDFTQFTVSNTNPFPTPGPTPLDTPDVVYITMSFTLNGPTYMASITILTTKNIVIAQALGAQNNDITITAGSLQVSSETIIGDVLYSSNFGCNSLGMLFKYRGSL
jgi:hypothetical protein